VAALDPTFTNHTNSVYTLGVTAWLTNRSGADLSTAGNEQVKIDSEKKHKFWSLLDCQCPIWRYGVFLGCHARECILAARRWLFGIRWLFSTWRWFFARPVLLSSHCPLDIVHVVSFFECRLILRWMRTRQISLMKPSLGHISLFYFKMKGFTQQM